MSRSRERAGRDLLAPGQQVARAQAIFLQPQAVVLLGLADPLHPHALHHRDSPCVRGPHERDDLLDALLERPPSQRETGLGGIAVAPGLRMKRPADLELVIGRQRQQGRSADDLPVLAALDRPPTSGRQHARIFGDPLLQHHAHRCRVANLVQCGSEPVRDLGISIRTERRGGVLGVPAAQNDTLGHQSLSHSAHPSQSASYVAQASIVPGPSGQGRGLTGNQMVSYCEDMDPVFRALADPTRRALLDELFTRDGQTLIALTARHDMTRIAVAKHLKILEEAGLVLTRRRGREKLHYLNPVPIRLVHDRWVSKYTEPWAAGLADLKRDLESQMEKVFEIYIRTTPARLWEAITDPATRKKYHFGAAVESDWAAGSPYRLVHPAAEEPLMEGE